MTEILTQKFTVSNEIPNPINADEDTAYVTSMGDAGTLGYIWVVRPPHGYRLLTVVGAMVQAGWDTDGGGYELGHYSPVDVADVTSGTASLKFLYRLAPEGARISGYCLVAFVKG